MELSVLTHVGITVVVKRKKKFHLDYLLLATIKPCIMQLPNPFTSVVSSKPSSSFSAPTSSYNTINPGPGLPLAQTVTYNYSPSNIISSNQNSKLKSSWGNSNRSNFGSQCFSFSCDRCDRSFKSAELLAEHVAEHIPCGIDGCPFVAHPKIVEKHIQMQHETGLASKIMKLTTPEEIDRWREERKK